MVTEGVKISDQNLLFPISTFILPHPQPSFVSPM
jgi:hypothetical protein